MEHKEGEGKEASIDELDVRDITLADLGLTEPPVMNDFQEIVCSNGTVKRVPHPPVLRIFEAFPGIMVRIYSENVNEESIRQALREEAKEIRDGDDGIFSSVAAW